MAYTNLDDPSAHFQLATYTGTGATQSVGNDGNSDLKPDWVWIKKRSALGNNSVFDSTRGVYKELVTNGTIAEATDVQLLTQFDTDGFTVGTNSGVNGSGATFVAWQWKANGGTTVTNTDGSANSTVQANTDAGFSIVEITGTGANATYGHGLGVKPQVVLIKRTSAIGNWLWLTSVIDGTHDYLYLNSDGSQNVTSYDLPTSSVFQYNDTLGATSIVYCFAEKQGFSKLGKYVGNGSTTNGPFVYTGFKPAFVMIKATDAIKNWIMFDNKRLGYNGGMYFLYANTDNAEAESPSSGAHIDLLSNGFKIYDNFTLTNQNTVNYIYMAFAENPFVTSTGIPTTAR